MLRGPAPPRAPGYTSVSVGSAREVGVARCRHPLDRLHGGARRRVDLAGVVQLDHLGGVEPRCRHLGEAHHQHRRDREVRRDQAVRAGFGRERGVERRQVVVGEPGRADDRVDALHRQPRQRRPCGVGDREVDDDVAVGVDEGLELGRQRDAVTRRWPVGVPIDRRHQREIGVDLDRRAHRTPHLTRCTVDADSHGAERTGWENDERGRPARRSGPHDPVRRFR